MKAIWGELYCTVEVMLDFEQERTVTLGELTPEWWL